MKISFIRSFVNKVRAISIFSQLVVYIIEVIFHLEHLSRSLDIVKNCPNV